MKSRGEGVWSIVALIVADLLFANVALLLSHYFVWRRGWGGRVGG